MEMEGGETFDPELITVSPGRINLIGEHTDYNMGYVLPTAIDKKIILKFRKNNSDNTCRVYSHSIDRWLTIDLNRIERSGLEWENYILGVIHEIKKRSTDLAGFDCTIESHLPIGSGLSSSAALECGLAFGLNKLFDLGLERLEIVRLAQKAEHSFVGTQCGIMDQFASVISKEGHVLLLDCESLEFEYIPIDIAPYKFLLLNTHVSHNLATSEYNVRKSECEDGLAIIRNKFRDIDSLRHVDRPMLSACKDLMDDTIYARCKYVIEENERVLLAGKALKGKDLSRFGTLLYESHLGLSKLYEISCPESDFLVNYTRDLPEVLGARQMGGGFGGCTLNLIEEEAIELFVKKASKAYYDQFNIRLTPIEVFPSTGTEITYNKQDGGNISIIPIGA